jgi:hypothetical protein
MNQLKFVSAVVVLIFGSFQTMSCQRGGKDISNTGELKIRFEYPATRADTQIYRIAAKAVSPAIPAPTTFTFLNNDAYLIKTGVVDLGQPTVTFKVPVHDAATFNRLRTFRLIDDDIEPRGYRWTDCTVTKDAIDRERPPAESVERDPMYASGYEAFVAEMTPLLPNFTARTVNCFESYGLGWNLKEYVAVTLASEVTPPPLTDISGKFQVVKNASEESEGVYRVIVENRGDRAAAEINLTIRSDDVRIISIRPSQGKCQHRRVESGEVCHLGPLAPKAAASIEIRALAQKLPTPPGYEDRSEVWSVTGYPKEKADDARWLTKIFTIEERIEK